MRKIELLCPASSLEVLKIAVIYGADAVYIGGEAFGLRAKAKNFSMEEMAEGVAFAHAHGVRVYVTANILAHNYDLDGVREYFTELHNMKPDRPDALIIADPGVFEIAKEVCPEIERHISTKANNTNYATYNFWYRQGASRVVSARELSLKEIKEIRERIPEDLEIETFIIGLCAGLIGIGLTLLLLIPGNAIIHSVADNAKVNAVLPIVPAIILILLSVVLTLLGGLIPSKKAAKSDPVTALRTE